ncbi:MAG: nucleotide exchange factor GrpE [Alistipes sp.]
MKSEKTYNEAVSGDEGFAPGEGYPSCDGHPCDNVADEADVAADTLADDAPNEVPVEASVEESPSDNLANSDVAAEWQDKFVRLQAEFDNYRKRTLREKMELVQTGGTGVLLTMLPVRDDVERAVEAMGKSDDIEALRAGVNLIAQKFTEALKQKGVIEIDLKGKEFDADLSEAVARFAAGDAMKGRVVDVIQTGYMLGEKVLRFAKVVVGE